ncbi:alpha/beta hydrolase [Bdellovibrio sp. NC01]|uniref:alpha/beta hydrolase n=1 Tax=Bdellovibrio sp. NC01 TaxID=2220073 RepID=UPI00115914E1|nr:alpha/beta hydrolase [Bdellovibrio sp. NC01]QDK38273.1 alpha/beta hydrolase [Bdellovibrio sp. NC01]
MQNTNRWILLRGLARGRGHWGSFATEIQKKFPNDQFEFLDLKGNGERFAEKSPLTVAEFVKDLRERSQFVKEKVPFKVLSVSLGAMITVEWMRQYPHEIEKAFLVCTSSSSFSPFYDRFMLHNYLPSLSLTFAKDPARWEKTILGMVVNNHERREAEMPAMIEYSRENPMQVLNVVRQLKAAASYSFPKEAPGDIQLIGSHGDRLVNPSCTPNIAQAWNLKAAMHPWAGHDIPVDDPKWLLEHLL